MIEINGRSFVDVLKRTELTPSTGESLVKINPYFENRSFKDQLESIDWLLSVGEYESYCVMDIESNSPSYVHHLYIKTNRLILNLGHITLSVEDPYPLIKELDREFNNKGLDPNSVFFNGCSDESSNFYDCKKFKRNDGTLLAYSLYKKDHEFNKILSVRDKERLLSLMHHNISYFL